MRAIVSSILRISLRSRSRLRSSSEMSDSWVARSLGSANTVASSCIAWTVRSMSCDSSPFRASSTFMNATQRAHFRKVLEALKGELSQDIDRTVQAMQDDATVFADPNDRATQESDISLELRNRDRERK